MSKHGTIYGIAGIAIKRINIHGGFIINVNTIDSIEKFLPHLSVLRFFAVEGKQLCKENLLVNLSMWSIEYLLEIIDDILEKSFMIIDNGSLFISCR